MLELQDKVHFFDVNLSNFSQFYGEAFEKHMSGREIYQPMVLQYKCERWMFQNEPVERKDLTIKEVT